MKFKKISGRKLRQKLGLRLGKKIKSKLGLKSKSALSGVSSARGVDGIYGPTGSIVGRY